MLTIQNLIHFLLKSPLINSIVQIFFKLIEITVCDQFIMFFEVTNCLDFAQFGIRRVRFTVDAMDKLVQVVLLAFENKAYA